MSQKTIEVNLPDEEMGLLLEQACEHSVSVECYAELLLAEAMQDRRRLRNKVVTIGSAQGRPSRRKGDGLC